MAKSLEEKRREREAAKKTAESTRPPAPAPAPTAAPLTEPPAGKADKAPETRREAAHAPAATPVAVVAPTPSPKLVAAPRTMKAASSPKLAPVPQAAAPKASPPPVPKEEVEVPASLAGANLSGLDELEVPEQAPEPVPAPALKEAAPRDSTPPASGPKSEPPKLVTKKIAFKEVGEGRRIGDVRIDYEGAAGPGAVKAKVTAYGKEHEVVLPRKESQRVSFQAPDGSEVSVALMFTGANKEGDKEILADIGDMESTSDKAKQAASKAISTVVPAASKLWTHRWEVLLSTWGAAISTTLLAVTDLRVWTEQHMGNLRWGVVAGIPLVMIGISAFIWRDKSEGKKAEAKTEDKTEA